METIETQFESKKLNWCKTELKALLLKLMVGDYQQTAEVVFDHVAHTGVETDLKPELKQKPTLQEFLESK